MFAPILLRLPPQLQRETLTGALPIPEGMDAKFIESFKRAEQLVKRLWDITIVAGTDTVVGIGLHHELELYSEAGIPNADVLSIATIGAARVMKRDARSGSITKGKDADLVIVDGDPLSKMSDVRNVVTTIRSGVVIDAVAAQSALSIAPRDYATMARVVPRFCAEATMVMNRTPDTSVPEANNATATAARRHRPSSKPRDVASPAERRARARAKRSTAKAGRRETIARRALHG